MNSLPLDLVDDKKFVLVPKESEDINERTYEFVIIKYSVQLSPFS